MQLWILQSCNTLKSPENVQYNVYTPPYNFPYGIPLSEEAKDTTQVPLQHFALHCGVITKNILCNLIEL